MILILVTLKLLFCSTEICEPKNTLLRDNMAALGGFLANSVTADPNDCKAKNKEFILTFHVVLPLIFDCVHVFIWIFTAYTKQQNVRGNTCQSRVVVQTLPSSLWEENVPQR